MSPSPAVVLAIAAGGALGALARYGVGLGTTRLFGHGFPVGTLAVNVLGSFFLGVLATLLAHRLHLGPEIRAFLVTGLLGAFTTFSAFSLDTVTLLERGQLPAAGLYVLASIVLAVAALVIGLRLGRVFIA